MATMNFDVFTSQIIRTWPRIEKYQNSTLRYTPPKDFAAHWVNQNFQPKIIRTWVTLDEIWDEFTDTYDWNYQIGVDKLGDKRYYHYDWPISRPSETHFEDYLTTFCSLADEAMLNIRRYERELADGVMSFDKYEEVVEKVIEHCRDLCPNIVYIEASNESEIPNFGQITVAQYMPIYNAICRVVNRLNARRGWNLKVGGTAMTGSFTLKGMWHEYMKALSENDCPDKRIDFYSMHAYNPDTNALQQIYNIHRSDLKKYNLPDMPVFFDEYGTLPCSPEPLDSLRNASGTLVGMMRSSDFENFSIFPWCTFHNPVLQMSYTQYIRLPEGGYAPTPNGLSVHMLGNMLEEEVRVFGDTHYRVRCTKEGNKLYLILSNPDGEALDIHCNLLEVTGKSATLTISQVDAENNNAVMNPPCLELGVTEERKLAIVKAGANSTSLTVSETEDLEDTVINGMIEISAQLPPYGFACWTIDIQ